MRGDGALETESADNAGFGGFWTEFAIGGEVIPEEKRRIPPAAGGPALEVSEIAVTWIENGEDEAAIEDVGFGERRVGHDETGESGGGSSEFVGARVAFADGVINGPGDGDVGGAWVGILDAIAKDGDGETGIIGVVRDERREGFEGDLDGECVSEKSMWARGNSPMKRAEARRERPGAFCGTEAVLPFVGRLIAGFEDVGDRFGGAAFDVGPDGREARRRDCGLCRGG